MKALTVQQPWAWAIVHGGKDVENRSQAWSYRGPLAIHAGARWSDRGAVSPLVVKAALECVLPGDPATPGLVEHVVQLGGVRMSSETVFGAIVGVVDLVDVHSADWCWEPDGHCSPWAEPSGDRDVVHLVLANPRPLAEPIPCKGRLGLWTPPAYVLEQLQEVAGA